MLFIEPAELNGALLPGVPATPIEARVRLDTFDVCDRATWTISSKASPLGESTLLESSVAWDALEQKFVFGPAAVLVAQPMFAGVCRRAALFLRADDRGPAEKRSNPGLVRER
jgi:hypothetical protein